MGYYSMPKYFQNMPTVGKALVNPNAENETEIKEIEKQIHDKVTEILAAGITTEEKLMSVVSYPQCSVSTLL